MLTFLSLTDQKCYAVGVASIRVHRVIVQRRALTHITLPSTLVLAVPALYLPFPPLSSFSSSSLSSNICPFQNYGISE
jgi:hypothetical protein